MSPKQEVSPWLLAGFKVALLFFVSLALATVIHSAYDRGKTDAASPGYPGGMEASVEPDAVEVVGAEDKFGTLSQMGVYPVIPGTWISLRPLPLYEVSITHSSGRVLRVLVDLDLVDPNRELSVEGRLSYLNKTDPPQFRRAEVWNRFSTVNSPPGAVYVAISLDR